MPAAVGLCKPDRHHWTEYGHCAHCPAVAADEYESLREKLVKLRKFMETNGGVLACERRLDAILEGRDDA